MPESLSWTGLTLRTRSHGLPLFIVIASRFPRLAKMAVNVAPDFNRACTSPLGVRRQFRGIPSIKSVIPLSRTILSGFSQGGAMALDVGLRLPCMALVSMSGYWHDSVQLTRESLPPVLIVHGRQDPVVPISKARQVRDNLKALGITVTYQEFDMAHQILPEELMLVRRFVLDVIG
ncbi:alpha/beta hydrolase [Coleofasciculus sp.]|uniref:alpha/beta hydrolase n=1 Tax=Coleofasciculus sp. TaxID=3100458 RepID=UPI003A2325B9